MVVRIPVNRQALLWQIARYCNLREQTAFAPPTEEEIARGLDVPVDYLVDTLARSQRIIPLDAPVGDEQHTVLDRVVDDHQELSDTLLMRNSLKAEVTSALKSLDKREREVIVLYFGLDGTTPMTLQEIGARLGLTRERVRQIKEKALQKLRHPNRCEVLKEYYGD